MSGILRRIATQVVGGGMPVVHSMSRLPYAVLPERSPFERSSVNTSSAAERSGVAPEVDVQPRGGPERLPLVRPLLPPRELDVDPVSPVDERRARQVDEPRLEPMVSVHVAGPTRPTQEPTWHDASPDRAVDRILAAHSTVTAWHREPSEARLPSASLPTRRGRQPRRAPTVSDLPSPLIKMHVSGPAMSWPIRSWVDSAVRQSLEASSQGQGIEPAEVHVHIGRVEVTAVQEPTSTARPQKPGREPMSLDQYLSKRERRWG